MKKSYALLAAALCVGFSASANVQALKNVPVANADAHAQFEKMVEITDTQAPVGLKKVGASKKVTAVSDLYGVYVWNYVGMLSSNSGEQTGNVTIKAGPEANQVYITGMPYSDIDVLATVDVAKGTIHIGVQDAYYNTYYNQMVQVYWERYDVASKTWSDLPGGANGLIQNDGAIVFNENDAYRYMYSLSLIDPESGDRGYFFAAANNIFEIPDYFVFKASEWESIGTGKFTDVWFNPIMNQPIENVDVEIMRGVADPTQYLIVNPYGGSEWMQVNEGDGKGYIYLDASEPECVLIAPLVGSGLKEASEDEAGVLDEYFMFNEEGMKVLMNGYYVDEVMEEFGAIGVPLSTMVDNYISFENPKFGLTYAPSSQYWWGHYEDEGTKWVPTKTTPGGVTIPAAAVNAPEIDFNAPVEYFNLQGVKIAAPAEGELVIIRQGNKSAKAVVK